MRPTARTGRVAQPSHPRLHGRPARPPARRARGRPRIAPRVDPSAHELTPDETRALAANMVFAGLEATAKAACTGVYFLVHTASWRRWPSGLMAATTAATEVLRSPHPHRTSPGSPRTTWSARTFPARRPGGLGQHHGGLSRPKRYANPDQLDLEPRNRASSSPSGRGPLLPRAPPLPGSVSASRSRTLAGRFPRLELVGGDGNVEWDYEGFAGVVRLDCLVPS